MFVNVSYTHVVIVVAYLALTIAALVSIWRRDGADVAQKVFSTVAVIAVPFIGALLWLAFVAVRSRRGSTSGA
ncbi:PLDc N-terminal domain-containing protein [Cellulomonas sp. Sa3CUA2]|uniref:PLDc N-terminal domain-containing protein n=1 Tax=Cellulomonas avistercoris TaxID=2762242 RepID=A0ABR8QHN5_9CELL|nr:PLDc N-terminal domain-containing protein [Cellulomonas avistercoris]MBD7919824.1 PLDc N-terminal domain-containing protein [Cellulomonas avistercoris]